METAFVVFNIAALVCGVICLFAALLALGAYAVNEVMKFLKVWHIYMLAVSIKLHGKDYADQQFWWAVKERASKGDYFARMVAGFAMEHAPGDEREDSANG